MDLGPHRTSKYGVQVAVNKALGLESCICCMIAIDYRNPWISWISMDIYNTRRTIISIL